MTRLVLLPLIFASCLAKTHATTPDVTFGESSSPELQAPLAGDVIIDMLDVGQGDAIVIRAAGRVVLVDAGDRGKDTVEQLNSLGIDQIDLAVSTHPHSDHVGSMSSVLQAFTVGHYLDNGMPHTTQTYNKLMRVVEDSKVPYSTAVRGMSFELGDEVTLSVLFPEKELLRGTRSDLNSNSVVLLLTHNTVDLLLTGDAEAPTESQLMALGIPEIELLKVGHHGSKHSTGHDWLRRLSAEVALISVGANNRYDHPHPETIARLTDAGATIYRTDRSGGIRIISNGTSYEIFEGPISELGPVWPLPATTDAVDNLTVESK